MATDEVTTKTRVVIAGGGPAGSLMGIYLARAGSFKVDIFESSTPEVIADPSNRSYNIVFMKRGLDAIKEGGLDLAREMGRNGVYCSGASQVLPDGLVHNHLGNDLTAAPSSYIMGAMDAE